MSKYSKSMAQILREMNEATFVDNMFDANKPMSKIKADAKKYGITIKVKKGGGNMGADSATLTGSESGIIKYAQNHLDASKKVRNLRDLKKELGEIVNPDGERRRAKKTSQLGNPVKVYGKDKDDGEETNEDAVANAQKRLDKAKKIADLKKQITAIKSEQFFESAGEEAEKLGLDHLGFGRYGKDGKMSHKSSHSSSGDSKLVKADPKDIEDYEKNKDSGPSVSKDEPKKDEPKKDTPRQDNSPKTPDGKLLDREPNEQLGDKETINKEFEELTKVKRINYHPNGTTEITISDMSGGQYTDLSYDYQEIVDKLDEKGLEMGKDYFVQEKIIEDPEDPGGGEEITSHIKIRIIPSMAGFETDEEEDEFREKWIEKNKKYDYFDKGDLSINRKDNESDFNNEEMNHYVTAISRISKMSEAVAQKDAFVVTGGKGDNDQKIIGVFKDEKSAKKARDNYNKKNRPAKKSHFARIYKQTRLSQAGKRFKPGEKIGYMTYSNKAQFTKLKEDLDNDDKDTVKDIIKGLNKASGLHKKQAKQLTKDIEDETDLEEFTSKQIDRLKKEYESLRGKESGINPEKFAKLRKMMDRFQKPNLLALAKADIPILSSAAKAKLVIKFGMKWKSLPEDFIPYIDVLVDNTLDEQKGKFKEVDPKVIDRVELLMRGSRKEKDSIANMLNYLMPPEVVDMIRYKLKITQKRGKIKF